MDREIKFIPKTNNGYSITKDGVIYSFKRSKVKIIKQHVNKDGYFRAGIYINGKMHPIETHQLLAITYLNHIRCGHKYVVDHIDKNIRNNNLNNLRIVKQRDNLLNTDKKKIKGYKEVFHNGKKRYIVRIYIKGKQTHLGTFKDKETALKIYNDAVYKYYK